jgi:hypothetical protein
MAPTAVPDKWGGGYIGYILILRVYERRDKGLSRNIKCECV